MKTLAFDSTGPILSVGGAQDSRPLARRDAPANRSRGNLLDELIDQVLRDIGWTRADVEGLGLLTGPGSLTAMRLGWASAAGWAQSAAIPIVGWTVPEAHSRNADVTGTGGACCIHYRGDTFLLYDISRPQQPPRVIQLSPDSYASPPPKFLTGPGVIGRRELWQGFCGPHTTIINDDNAIIGGDVLAAWAATDLARGRSLALTNSPLEYGLPPDFKKLTPS